MITTGWAPTNGFSKSTYEGKRSEILDLSMSESYICSDWVDYPISLEGATAGVLGTNVVICGGGRCSSAQCQHQDWAICTLFQYQTRLETLKS